VRTRVLLIVAPSFAERAGREHSQLLSSMLDSSDRLVEPSMRPSQHARLSFANLPFDCTFQ